MSTLNFSVIFIFTILGCAHLVFASATKEVLSCAHANDLDKNSSEMAYQFYKEAFSKSFDNNWQVAQELSSCSALLDHGNVTWQIDHHNFSH